MAIAWQSDFSGLTVNAPPSGWTERLNTGHGAITVRNDGLYNNNCLELAITTSSRYAASITDLGNSVTDAEVLALIRHTENIDHNGRIFIRGGGSDGSESGYFGYFQVSADTVGIHKYNAGVSTSVGTAVKTIAEDTWYWVRFRIASDALKLKVWAYTDSEPGTWDVEQTDSALASGWVGLGGATVDGRSDFQYYGVSTDGTTVPLPSLPIYCEPENSKHTHKAKEPQLDSPIDHSVTPQKTKHLQKSTSPILFISGFKPDNAKHIQHSRTPLFTKNLQSPQYFVTPSDSKHTQTVVEPTFAHSIICAPENAKHLQIAQEYETVHPIGILDSPNTRILVDFLFSYGDFTPQFSTEDLYVNDAGEIKEYWRRLKESPEVLKELSNWFYGRPKDDTISLSFDNSDGWFTNMVALVECRNEGVRVRRYEPSELNSSDIITHEFTGVITGYEFSAVLFTIELSTESPNVLQTLIPKVLYSTDSWTDSPPLDISPTFDLGKPYPLAFGLAHRVPLVYVHANFTNDTYDYIMSHGPIEDVLWVYRDGVKINPDEYVLYKNDTVTYNGYAYIRFKVEQMTFNQGQMHQLTADVKGMTFGETFCERNFATVIKNILTNSTWGLGESVDTTSFAIAASQVSDLYCDGYIAEQKRAVDVLDKLLIACRGKLDRIESGAWTLKIDMPVMATSQSFGLNDGLYNNLTLKRIFTTPVNEAIKKIQLSYRYNTWENTYMMTNSRDVLAFGETLLLENEFIWEHSTADRITCFLEQMYESNDARAEIVVGNEGRMLREYNTVKLLIPHLSINDTYQVRSIRRRLKTFDLTLVKHANTIYVYNAQTLPTDEQAEDLPDFKNPNAPTYEKPRTPQSIGGLGWTFRVSASGDVTARLLARGFKHKDEINFSHFEYAYKLTTETNYKWYNAYEHDATTGEWRGIVEVPASTYPAGGAFPGGTGGAYINFDAVAKSVNVFGQDSDLVTFLNEQIPYKDVGVNDVSNLVQKIDGKTFHWSWDATNGYPTGTQDIKDYHVVVSLYDDFSTTLIDTFTAATTYSYTSTAEFGTQLFFRVRARNTTLIESWNWTTATGEVGDSDENGVNIISLPVCSTVNAGDFVNIYAVLASTPCVRKADASTIGKEAHGFVLDTVGSGSVKVFLSGNVNYKVHGTTGTLLTGGYMYLSDTVPGDFTNTPPTTADHFVQKLGLPISVVGSPMNFLFIYHEPVILV